MSLVRTVRAVINICRNPVKLTQCIWDELDAFDTRIDSVEGGIVDEGSIDTAELADEAVTPGKMADMNAEADMFIADADKRPTSVALSGDATLAADGTITIAEDAVDSTKIPVFVSDEQTGTGDVQNIAHGLGVEPSVVLILLSSVGTDGATYTYTKGSANVNVTATSGAKYYVVAIA